MPIYEYKCGKCSKEFECLVLKRDEAILCPESNNEVVERLMSACRFKSGGRSDPGPTASHGSGGSGCASCSGGNCATCH